MDIWALFRASVRRWWRPPVLPSQWATTWGTGIAASP